MVEKTGRQEPAWPKGKRKEIYGNADNMTEGTKKVFKQRRTREIAKEIEKKRLERKAEELGIQLGERQKEKNNLLDQKLFNEGGNRLQVYMYLA